MGRSPYRPKLRSENTILVSRYLSIRESFGEERSHLLIDKIIILSLLCGDRPAKRAVVVSVLKSFVFRCLLRLTNFLVTAQFIF